MSLEKLIENLRTRLLDLTGRNRLLNFKYSPKSVVRAVDEIPSILFQKIVDGSELLLAGIPEPKMEDYVDESPEAKEPDDTLLEKNQAKPRKIRPPVKQYAEAIGINSSFELAAGQKDGTSKRHQDNEIQTLLYPDELESVMSRIFNLYRTAIEETGNNLLYLTFGSLEYFESDDSDEPKRAPLVLVPVSLRRANPEKRNPFYTFRLTASGEEHSVNLSLNEKLKGQFGLSLPGLRIEAEDTKDDSEYDDSYSLDAYFSEVEAQIKKTKPRWRLIYEVTLATLPFGKQVLFKDLHSSSWEGASTTLLTHPIVNALCAGDGETGESATSIYAGDYAIDELAPASTPQLVYDADSSQHSALVDAMAGKNLVIEGPPGTGKSQTITNLIASALANGKTVLFVAEKLAALEVVKKRLSAVGLGDFCLELHSTKVQKKAVADSLKQRLTASFPKAREIASIRARLDEKKSDINAHVAELKKPVESLDRTYSDIISRFCFLRSEMQSLGIIPDTAFEVKPFSADLMDDSLLRRELEKIQSYFTLLESARKTYGAIEGHPWSLFLPNGESKLNICEKTSTIRTLQKHLSQIVQQLEGLPPLSETGFNGQLSLDVANSIFRSINDSQRFLSSNLPPRLLGALEHHGIGPFRWTIYLSHG